MNKLKRRIEWYLTTDFDLHLPLTKEKVEGIVALTIIVVVLGGIKAHA